MMQATMATISDSVLRAAQRINKLLALGGKESGLTPRQISVLLALSTEDGLSQVDIMDRCSMDRSTTSSVISLMKKKGLITRVRSGEDRRAFVVKLSVAGEDLVKQAKKLRSDVEKTIEGVMRQPVKTESDLIAIADIQIQEKAK